MTAPLWLRRLACLLRGHIEYRSTRLNNGVVVTVRLDRCPRCEKEMR